MIHTYSSQREKLIECIVAEATKSDSGERDFIRAFFAHAPLEDLELLSSSDACVIARDAYHFARERKDNDPKIDIHTIRTLARQPLALCILGDDMPFLVDSLSLLMQRLGITIDLILHPILSVSRSTKGTIKTVTAVADADQTAAHESLIILMTRGLPHAMDVQALEAHIRDVLHKVRLSVDDWKLMSEATLARASSLRASASADAEELSDFLHWLADKNFVFLGYADFDVNEARYVRNSASALGLYRLETPKTDIIEYHDCALSTKMIDIAKSSLPSEVHRAGAMDVITVKRLNSAGEIISETRILGLFTSNVYYQTTDMIPIIRGITARVLERSGFDPLSHNGKSLKAILEFLPRDELFQLGDDALFMLGMGVLALESRPRVRLFARHDTFARYVSCLVYVPRERFSTTTREQIERVLERAYSGSVATFYTQLSDSPLARIHIIITTDPNRKAGITDSDVSGIEKEITHLTNAFSDALQDAAIHHFGAQDGITIAQAYAHAFDSAYMTSHTGAAAMSDVKRIRDALGGDGLALELFSRPHEIGVIHLKCYTTDTESALSDVVPMLENMGTRLMDVQSYHVKAREEKPVLIRDFILKVTHAPAAYTGDDAFDLAAHKERLESALRGIWRGEFADDGLNALLLRTTLDARAVDILRVFCRYLRQVQFPYGQMVIWRALNQYPKIAEQIHAYFDARFNPDCTARDVAMAQAKTAIMASLESVDTLAEDRIFRRLLALIEAAMRTNAYQPDKVTIAIKFASALIPELPKPVPYAEIFVYSMATEGIHLRGDSVSRGGLRWSDRPEDFRTEVLGLMKAQMVKNAVIVPSGSKGGFVVKRPPADRAAFQQEGIRCYRQFLSGLLDLTDNRVGASIVAPERVVRHDQDDPYLVVAADKGTATFSDIANGISADYGFWLGDAFASGGSAGYDHKQMGITAKGAWISVVRHFREHGHDIATTPFTVVGVGDMSGDVFGNGMLLSRQIKLVAAFNHRHIFLDPTPDVAISFAERERLFALASGSWDGYNTALISVGGGVYERSLKTIPLSREVQTALGTTLTHASPDELIQIILTAPVDLLWNGGIGTYVKASEETHDDVGDRTNNALRVNGAQLRCKIVGEGGNLGFTQRGRIEYARSGGRINTDAIDNSAGVDCSDHEVNIKIALGRALEDKRFTIAERNELLKTMTDDVAHLVLEDNRLQTQALSLAESRSAALLEPLSLVMQDLEAKGLLNREVEFLPSDKQIAELKLQGLGLTRPELSVLLAYSKLTVAHTLTHSTQLDAVWFDADILNYFPAAMRKPYARDITQHPLRRAIIATVLTNELINRLGIVCVHQTIQDTGADAASIIDAYVCVREVFNISGLWNAIEALDGTIDPATQRAWFALVRDHVQMQMRIALKHFTAPMNLGQIIPAVSETVALLRAEWQKIVAPAQADKVRADIARYQSDGASLALATDLALLLPLDATFSIHAASTHQPSSGKKQATLAQTAACYYALVSALSIDVIYERLDTLPRTIHWQRHGIACAETALRQQLQRILGVILTRYGNAPDSVAQWLRSTDASFTRYQRCMASLTASGQFDIAMLMVVLDELTLFA